MRQDIVDLYDEYTHRGLDRRIFMERLATLAGGTAAAAAALAALRPDYAQAAIVPADDPRVSARETVIEVMSKKVAAYRARPAAVNQPKPVVVVIHENRGLNAHIQDVARRFATEGFLTVAPDFLTRLGGTPADEDKARDMIGQLSRADVMDDLSVVTSFLATDRDGNGKVGVVGFCWGGGVAGEAPMRLRSVSAAVVYYGRTPPLERVADLHAPLMLHYAGEDANVNAGVPDFEKALQAARKPFTLYRYAGAQHAFNNDTSEARYDKAASDLAWDRTVAFFKEHLAA